MGSSQYAMGKRPKKTNELTQASGDAFVTDIIDFLSEEAPDPAEIAQLVNMLTAATKAQDKTTLKLMDMILAGREEKPTEESVLALYDRCLTHVQTVSPLQSLMVMLRKDMEFGDDDALM